MQKLTDKIPHQESDLIEFKAFFGGISSKELSQTLCAFANADGGSVYLGVTDSGDRKGLKLTPSILDQIQNAAREGCVPPLSIQLSNLPVTSDLSVICISVEKSTRLHTTANGQVFLRIGTQDKRILGDELLRLAESKSHVSFEEEVLDFGMEVIDAEALGAYYQARRSVTASGKKLSSEELLLKLGLAVKENGKFRIKAGAFILFGRETETALLQRDFTFVHYKVSGGMYEYREDLSLPVTRVFDRMLELLRPYNRNTQGVSGLKRHEILKYPEEAIREAVLNAFGHRDYRWSGLKNEFRLYPDRLEIISPGGLPGWMTLETLGSRHYSRNPKIMHALMILGFVEELGQGISLMRSALKRNGNPPPEFFTSNESFKVVFRPQHVLVQTDFSVLEKEIEAQGTLSRSQIESLSGLKSTRTKYLIQKWIREKRIVRIGQGPGTRYKLKPH